MKSAKTLTTIAFSSLLLIANVGCGKSDSGSDDGDSTAATNTTGQVASTGGNTAGSGTPGATGTQDVSVSVQQDGFALMATITYVGSLANCLSGYSSSGITTASFTVLENDQNCEFQLDSMTLNSENFNDFTGVASWAQGQSFSVTGDGGTILNFSVSSQIASPISGAQSVSLTYVIVEEGTGVTPTPASASTGINISGSEPIGLEISTANVTLSGTGAGDFSFTLECDTTMSGNDCDTLDLTSLRFAVARRADYASPTLADCQTIADSGAQGSVIAPGTPVNGGISTGSLLGQAPLYGAGNDAVWLVAYKADSDDSCKYFQVDVQQP